MESALEHTAYLNLKNGIEAPQSGSVEQNGPDSGKQIGGQIFIDTWGLVNPCNPEKSGSLRRSSGQCIPGGEGRFRGQILLCCHCRKHLKPTRYI